MNFEDEFEFEDEDANENSHEFDDLNELTEEEILEAEAFFGGRTDFGMDDPEVKRFWAVMKALSDKKMKKIGSAVPNPEKVVKAERVLALAKKLMEVDIEKEKFQEADPEDRTEMTCRFDLFNLIIDVHTMNLDISKRNKNQKVFIELMGLCDSISIYAGVNDKAHIVFRIEDFYLTQNRKD